VKKRFQVKFREEKISWDSSEAKELFARYCLTNEARHLFFISYSSSCIGNCTGNWMKRSRMRI